jgi:hypothetical protein
MVFRRICWEDISDIDITKQNQVKRSSAYKLEQSAIALKAFNFLLEALIFLPQGS